MVDSIKHTRRFETPYGIFFSYTGDLITGQLEEFGAHTRNGLSMLLSLIPKGNIIIDVGAHIGTFTVPLAITAGHEAKVIAVEPSPDWIKLLKTNVSVNGLDSRVEIVESIISDEIKDYKQIIDPNNSMASYFKGDSAASDISVTSLDSIWRKQKDGRRVSAIKIDVEGMELSVLRSGQELLNHDRPILYIEIVEKQLQRYDTQIEDIEEMLRFNKYSFFINQGPRNSRNDFFKIVSLQNLRSGGCFFDCLAIPMEKVDSLIPRTQKKKLWRNLKKFLISN